MAEADYTTCVQCGAAIKQTRSSGKPKTVCSKSCKRHRDRLRNNAKYKKKQTVMTCKSCGVLFLRMPGGSTKWCSDACKPLKARSWWKQTKTIMSCVTCGGPFIPNIALPNAKYCSDACRGRSPSACDHCGKEYLTTRNSTGKYCSRSCAAKVNLAVDRETILKRYAGKRCKVEIITCICCETNLIGPRPVKTWAGKFCSECRDILGSAVHSNSGRIDFLRARLWGRRCEVCGDIFEPPQETSRCCSLGCYQKTEEGKAARRAHKVKRRAKKKTNGPYHDIDPIDVFERDGWVCYLCATPTPRELRGSWDDCAPEMDHIVALSVGGTHTWDNVACACRKCNQKKSNNTVVKIAGRWHMLPKQKHGQAVCSQTFV